MNSSAVSSEKVFTVTTAIPSSRISEITLSISISSRVILISRDCISSPRKIVSFTSEPISPRIFLTASKRVRSEEISSSILKTLSPGSKPALSAGEPRNGEIIVIISSRIPTSAPIPVSSPSREAMNRSLSVGVRNSECGSPSDSITPFIAP